MIICVVGPTGVGKSDLSIRLAKKFNAFIINADATQIYKELNIGSAKITKKQMQEIKHHMINIKSPDEEYSVMDYQLEARKILNNNKDKNIIVCGGTGLYIKALFYEYEFPKISTFEIFQNLTNKELYDLALKKDPNMDINLNNRVRLINFLNRPYQPIKAENLLYDVIFIGLKMDREQLYDKCNQRVDKMFKEGLLEEVKVLYKKYPTSKILRRAIGYKELIMYLEKEISLEEAKELIKKHTRNYVKRQYTWFNNQMNIKWFDVSKNLYQDVIEYVSSLNSK